MVYAWPALALTPLYLCKRGVTRFVDSARNRPQMRDTFYRSMWETTAREMGAGLKDIGFGILEITHKEESTRVCRNLTELDDVVSMTVAGNKYLVSSLLLQNGIPTPRSITCDLTRLKPARKFISTGSCGFVVKPAFNTAGGLGVSTSVHDSISLVRSAARAGSYGRTILIEEQVSGDNYRLFYLNGKFLHGVLRRPPCVTGDGKRRIRALIKRENTLRLKKKGDRAQTLIGVDEDMKSCLAKQGLTLGTICEQGKKVFLKTVINENNCHENEPVSDAICQSIIDNGASAARLIGPRIAGVDIITRDPSVPLQDSGGVVLEVNTTPGFYYHYRNTGEPFPLARYVLEAIFQTR